VILVIVAVLASTMAMTRRAQANRGVDVLVLAQVTAAAFRE
jgi:hypothetical protein